MLTLSNVYRDTHCGLCSHSAMNVETHTVGWGPHRGLSSELISMFLAILWSNSCYLNLSAKNQCQNYVTSLRLHNQHQKRVVATRNLIQNECTELCSFSKFSPNIIKYIQGWDPASFSQVLTAQPAAVSWVHPDLWPVFCHAVWECIPCFWRHSCPCTPLGQVLECGVGNKWWLNWIDKWFCSPHLLQCYAKVLPPLIAQSGNYKISCEIKNKGSPACRCQISNIKKHFEAT